MPFFSTPFDPSSIPLTASLIEEGPLVVKITHSENRLTKDGKGQYLLLQLEALEGPYSGRLIFDRLNLINENPRARQIASQTLAKICLAVGKSRILSSEELHEIPLVAVVRIEPARDGYEASNSIKGYLPLSREVVSPQKVPGVDLTARAVSQVLPSIADFDSSLALPWKRRA